MGSYIAKKSPSQKLNSVYTLRRVREFLQPPMMPLCRRMSADPILLSNHVHSDFKMATLSCLMTEFPNTRLRLGFVCVFVFSPKDYDKGNCESGSFCSLGFYTLARKESKMFSRVPFNIKNLSITTEYMALYLD